MTKRRETSPTPLGIYDKTIGDRITVIEVAAIGFTVLWLLLTAVFFIAFQPDGDDAGVNGPLKVLIILMAVFLPVAMIWVAATAARSSRVMREESLRLQSAIDAIRQAYITQSQTQAVSSEPTVAKKLDEIAAAQRKTETTLAMFSSTRVGSPSPPPPAVSQPDPNNEDQVALPLGTTAEDIQAPLEQSDFIRSLNFPETAEDKEGFAALRRALKDRTTSQLIQASQDVLTLLSQDGIYMDDLRPDMARPEIWRRFAAGERGRQIATLGGVRDRSSLALSAGRMRTDPIFRDAVHHFLRKFDKVFSEFAERASDTEISDLSDTRTARAFMLLGRVAGTFD